MTGKEYNPFQITHKDKKTKARTGLLNTKKGKIETPFFMPVATKASVKHLSSKDLNEIGVSAVISNTFILGLKPGAKQIQKLGGIGKFMNFNGVNVTDSGGFQMYSKNLFIKSNESGVWFRNPFTQEKIYITPSLDMQLQFEINSEVAMCLDSMPLIEDSKEKIAEAVRKTTKWAEKCKEEQNRLQKNIPQEKRQLLFGISQGGIYKDLREKSVKEILNVGFDGYALGGLALGEKRGDEYKMIEVAKKILPENRIVYLMGIGDPIEILEAISRGVDMFDSRLPTQNARRGTIFTSKGKLRIFNKKYELDTSHLDKNCQCFTCQNYSRAYIRYLLKQEEGLGYRLATYHNVYFMTKLMEKAKEEITKGKFGEFLKKMKRDWRGRINKKIKKN